MYPLSFDEFLRAMKFDVLADQVRKATPDNPFSDELHKKCMEQFSRFLLIGRMPEVVTAYARSERLHQYCNAGAFVDQQPVPAGG